MKRFLPVLFSLCVLSFGTTLAQCETDADCDDGIFCTGTETCNTDTGQCQIIDPCAAAIIGECLVVGACDFEADECFPPLPDDSLCAAEEICAANGDCVIPGQDVGSALCGQVQIEAQVAVESGGPYRNHGQMVKTAANVVSPYSETGAITEECSSCIVNQFARRVPIEEQEPCGGTLCPCFDSSDILGQGIDFDAEILTPHACYVSLPDLVQIEGQRVPEQTMWVANAAVASISNLGQNQCFLRDDLNAVYSLLYPITDEEVAACLQILLESQMWELNCSLPE